MTTDEARRLMGELSELEALCAEKRRRLAAEATELFEIAGVVRGVVGDAKGALAHELSLMRMSHRLTNRKMVSPEKILDAAVPMDSFPGVYFLIRQGEIVYVGQSRNVFYRVPQHTSRKVDRWAFVPCEPEDLNVVESLYIHLIRPEDNRRAADGTMNAPLSMEALFEMMLTGARAGVQPGADVEDC